MTGVNSGSLVQVKLPDFSGRAGFVETAEDATLCYRPSSTAAVPIGHVVTIEGAAWSVVKSVMSTHVTGFRLLTLKKQDG